jgi:hypothetical protein
MLTKITRTLLVALALSSVSIAFVANAFAISPTSETGPQRTATLGVGDVCDWDPLRFDLGVPEVLASLPPQAPSDQGIQCPISMR